MGISFFKPIANDHSKVCNFAKSPEIINNRSSLSGKINAIADDYFSFSSKGYAKTNFYEGNTRIITPVRIRRSLFGSIAKVLSYFTVVIPIYMIFHKMIYRMTLKCRVESNIKLMHKVNPNNNPKPAPRINNPRPVQARVEPVTTSPPPRVNISKPALAIGDFDEVEEFSLDLGKLSVDLDIGLKKKPVSVTPQLENIDVNGQIQNLDVVAQSLGVENRYINNLRYLQGQFQSSHEQTWELSKRYTAGILDFFNKDNTSTDLKKEVLTNIGRDCSPGLCAAGILTKIQKEYSRLLGAGEDDVEQIFLIEIDDLKLEKLNAISGNYVGDGMQIHFVAAAKIHLKEDLGLNEEGARLDSYLDEVNHHFNSNLKKQQVINRFLQGYTPELLIEYVGGKINGNLDSNGHCIHLDNCNDFFLNILSEQYFPKPDSLEELQNGPLKEYVAEVLDGVAPKFYPPIDTIYKGALGEVIKRYFIEYTEVNYMEIPTKIRTEGIAFILRKLNIIKMN